MSNRYFLSPRLLTESTDRVVAMLGVQHLFEDVRRADAVTNDEAAYHDVLFPRRCPTDDDRVGERTDSQRRRLAWHGRL